jgi:hypothetical protein
MTQRLHNEEPTDLLSKSRHIAAETQQTKRDALLTVAANEHPEKPVCVAYAPANQGYAVHAYDGDTPGRQAQRSAYNTTTLTYNALHNASDTVTINRNMTLQASRLKSSLLKHIESYNEP